MRGVAKTNTLFPLSTKRKLVSLYVVNNVTEKDVNFNV